MKNTIALEKTTIKTKTLITLAAIISAVALPQVFHWAGLVSGLGGPQLGAAFLPMHIPVIVAGLLAGPIAGLIAGIISPLISFGLAGMPVAAMLPFIMLELAVYGMASGLLYKAKFPVFGKLIIAQIAGRVVRAGAVLAAAYALGGNTAITAEYVFGFIVVGVPGILLQWALIPLIIYRAKGRGK